jgi:hypothetical protein
MKKKKEPMKVELIQIYISKEEFAEKKEVVQNLIAKILINAHLEEQKEKKLVRFPPPSNLLNG